MALTPKQKAFVQEYLVDLNATAAARRAGYKDKAARSIGAENLTKPDIQSAIQKAQAERENRTQITQDRVVEELAKIAFADATDYAHIADSEDGPQIAEYTPTEKLSPGQKAAISEINNGKFGVTVKTYDKLQALELLGKHLGMFTERKDDKDLQHDDPLSAALLEEAARMDAEDGGTGNADQP